MGAFPGGLFGQGSSCTILNLLEAEQPFQGLGVHSELSAVGNRERDVSALGAHGSLSDLCPAESEAGEDPALHSRDREHFGQ